MTKEQQRALQSAQIKDCLEREKNLTEWEVSFIKSIENRRYLTVKQLSVLARIWEKATDLSPIVRRPR